MSVPISPATLSSARRDLAITIVLLLVALGLRMAVILTRPEQLTIDRDAYLGIAHSVADGRGYCSSGGVIPTAFRPPLYPVILGLGFRWFPVPAVVATVNLLAGLTTVVLTIQIGRNLGLGALRFVAALLVATDPLLLQYAAQPMTESLCTALAASWLCFATQGPGKKMGSSGFLTGMSFGLLVLCRPTFWPVAGLFAAGWLVTILRRSRTTEADHTTSCSSGIWTACGTAIVASVWLVRNWLVIGVPILTTTHGGYTLLLGNNPVFYEQVVSQPWGTTWSDASQKQWDAILQQQMAVDLGPDASETARDAWQSRAAKAYIAANPRRTVESSLHRIRSLWKTAPQGEATTEVNPQIMKAVGWYYSVVLIAGLIGVMLVLVGVIKRTGSESSRCLSPFSRWLPLYALVVTVQLVHLLYWTNTRMRAPLTPAIALFAVTAIPKRSTN